MAEFWRARTPLEELPAGVTPAAIPDALIRTLEEPAFWSGPGRLRDHLNAVYELVARDAKAKIPLKRPRRFGKAIVPSEPSEEPSTQVTLAG